MSDNVIFLDHLRAIRTSLDTIQEDIREIKGRLAILEVCYGSLSSRIDRMELRLERIEKRLELVEV
jgi:predicted nuclease with TOPRIM domain